MSDTNLPLDEAAWEAIANDGAHPRGTGIAYLRDGKAHTVYSREMARAALALRARVAELEAENAALRDDNEHFRKQAWERVLEANALRDALQDIADTNGCDVEGCTNRDCLAGKAAKAALASTPAASLAAYRKSVLTDADREWATALCGEDTRIIESVTTRLLKARAIAAQEVK